ncbi:MAG: DNA-directed RNA polymerase subunit RpoH/Rpb5 C-terminal domain-containing protein [Candidatus Micrarchaeota archaeon]
MEEPSIRIKHFLQPEAELANADDIRALEKQGISLDDLPHIFAGDVSITELSAPAGSVVKFMRKSPVTGREETYYRLVIE